MLVFKKNIYSPTEDSTSNLSENPLLDPYSFVFNSMLADRDLFLGLSQLGQEERSERFKLFFPHASRFASFGIVNAISKRLLESLVIPDKWFQLNAYHLCYLYDSLSSMIEEYSYETTEQRVNMFPELNGEPIDFNDFLENYFLNTAFLMDPERFNSLDSQEKENRGLIDPCLFGAINRLVPSQEEINLKEVKNPYI